MGNVLVLVPYLRGNFLIKMLCAILNRELPNNCIKISNYIVVVCNVLCQWKLSHCLDNTWLSSSTLIGPHKYARIFRRLSAELTCVYSDDQDSLNQSDSQRFYTCLGDLDSDMDKAHNPMECKDGEVHFFKEIQPYKDCLQLMAEVLENCTESEILFDCVLWYDFVCPCVFGLGDVHL